MGNGKKPNGAKPVYNTGFADKRKSVAGFFLDLAYPRRCPVCHDVAAPFGRRICRPCAERLVPVKEPRCQKCSKPISNAEAEYCFDCSSKTHLFHKGIGIFPYNTILSKSLYQLKYYGRSEYASFYGSYAACYAKDRIMQWGIQVLVPIPLHYRRQQIRGYNQAEKIAIAMGKELGIPVECKAVKRVENTKPQKELTGEERRRNMQHAFVPGETKMRWKRVLIVDDIYTTGSTIDGTAKALKQAGAEEIYFLTIAIGGGF